VVALQPAGSRAVELRLLGPVEAVREGCEVGKPAVGAAVMLAAPLAALDIPLKVLVWEDRNGAVSVSYNSPGFLAGRHHLEGALRAPFRRS
jgi:hypothetical protein